MPSKFNRCGSGRPGHRSGRSVQAKVFARLNSIIWQSAAFVVWASIFCIICQAQNIAAEPTAKASEQIHYGDIVDIDVIGSLEFDWRGGLTPEGFLEGPNRLEKPVFALCRTVDDVGAAVRAGYQSILRDPNVVVRIIDRSNRALAYVDGAVKKPQRYQLKRPVSLAELMVLSGGISDTSSGEISIFRPPNVNCRDRRSGELSFENAATQAPRKYSIQIADLLSGKQEANMSILTGDIVTVVEAPPVFVTGDVRSPRRMNLTPELTLSRAISAAGGAVKLFSGQRARIFRRGAKGVLDLDMQKVFEGGENDLKLEPYDVIDVEQKGVEPRRIAPIAEPIDRAGSGLSRLPLRIVD